MDLDDLNSGLGKVTAADIFKAVDRDDSDTVDMDELGEYMMKVDIRCVVGGQGSDRPRGASMQRGLGSGERPRLARVRGRQTFDRFPRRLSRFVSVFFSQILLIPR